MVLQEVASNKKNIAKGILLDETYSNDIYFLL
jgi:hypothetical protein